MPPARNNKYTLNSGNRLALKTYKTVEGHSLMEKFFIVALAAIIIPYGLMFLALMWSVIRPAMGKRRGHGAKQEKTAPTEMTGRAE